MKLIAILQSVLLILFLPPVAFAQNQDSENDYQITFLSHRTGQNILYKTCEDAKEIAQIFGGEIPDLPPGFTKFKKVLEPHWTKQSPDGKYFASWVYEFGKPSRQFKGFHPPKLVIGDIQGKWTRTMNSMCGEEFAWSPDSKKIAYHLRQNSFYTSFHQNDVVEASPIFIEGIDGSEKICVLDQKGLWTVLDWSPDGERLLLDHRQFRGRLEDTQHDIYEFDFQESLAEWEKQNTVNEKEWAAVHAPKFLRRFNPDLNGLQINGGRYSPDGKELALQVYDPKNMFGPNQFADPNNELEAGFMRRLLGKLAVLNLSTKKFKIVAEFEEGIAFPHCWSPDGKKIFFTRYLGKDDHREKIGDHHGLGIWSVDRDGKNVKFLTTGWSPSCPRN